MQKCINDYAKAFVFKLYVLESCIKNIHLEVTERDLKTQQTILLLDEL